LSAIEQRIGELTAAAACLVARGLGEFVQSERFKMSADTRRQGGALMVALIELRQGAASKLDFEQVARTHGTRVLRGLCGSAVSTAVIDELIAAAIDILDNIIRLRLN
jgi:hypothetical protein